MRYFLKSAGWVVFALGMFFIIAGAAHAQGIVPAECVGAGAVDLCRACSFFKLIDNTFTFILTRVVPPLAVILIAIGGFLYLVSGDSEQRRTQARGILTWTVVGLVLVYASFILLHTVLTVLAGDRVDVEGVFLITSRGFEIVCAIPSPPPPPPPLPPPPPPPPPATISPAHQAAAAAAGGFTTFVSSGECGVSGQSVTPRTNIEEAASGKPITFCSNGCTPNEGCGGTRGGGRVTPNLNLLQSFETIRDQCGTYQVTSIAGGSHSPSSDHYAGRAMDMQVSDHNRAKWTTCLLGLQAGAGSTGVDPGKTFCDRNGVKVDCKDATHIHITFRP